MFLEAMPRIWPDTLLKVPTQGTSICSVGKTWLRRENEEPLEFLWFAAFIALSLDNDQATRVEHGSTGLVFALLLKPWVAQPTLTGSLIDGPSSRNVAGANSGCRSGHVAVRPGRSVWV